MLFIRYVQKTPALSAEAVEYADCTSNNNEATCWPLVETRNT